MPSGEKERLITLPLKVILTQEGSTFFIKKKRKLLKFKLAGNVEEYGIALEQFDPSTIQRLILMGYVAKIEVSKSEFITSRQEVMDLSKLVVFSVLYNQYDEFVFNQLINSAIIKKWNRQNPANIIDEKTHINEKLLANVLEKNKEELHKTKKEILEPLHSFIMSNATLEPAEKNVQLFLSEKFLDHIRPFTWFIITKFKKSEEQFAELLKTLRSSLVEYMDKTKIAEYISLMLMELIINAENTNLKKELGLLFPDMKDSPDALLDPAIRRRLVLELEQKEELVYVTWKISGGNASLGATGKIQITLYTKNEEAERVKASLNDVKSTDTEQNSLLDFYKKSEEGADPTNMGMYYISYLSEACEKVNVRFESNVNQFADSDLTVMNMFFMF
jgi:hypothetical protein